MVSLVQVTLQTTIGQADRARAAAVNRSGPVVQAKVAKARALADPVTAIDPTDLGKVAVANKTSRVMEIGPADLETMTGPVVPVKVVAANNGGQAIDPTAFRIGISGAVGETIIAMMFGTIGTTTGTDTAIGTTMIGGITTIGTIRTIPISTIGAGRRGRR